MTVYLCIAVGLNQCMCLFLSFLLFHKLLSLYIKLEALGERRPPWPRQIITPILPTVEILSLDGERLIPKVLDRYLHAFAHLLILEYIDHHQNLISSSLFYLGPLHKI